MVSEVIGVRKTLCIMLVLLLIGSTAFAVPQLSGHLFDCAKQAMYVLSSGEYERLVTLLPYSGDATSAAEWERFAGNFSDLSHVQTEYAVAYWTGSAWVLAVPAHVPDSADVETLVLGSEDGSTIIGYGYRTWGRIEKEYTASDYVIWNEEYVSQAPTIVAD